MRPLLHLLAVTLLLPWVGCGDDDAYRLGWRDRGLLPYEGGEILVFASEGGGRDTIHLVGYEERLVSPTVAEPIGKRQFEEYRLRAERYDRKLGRAVLQDDAVKVYRHTAGQTSIRFALMTQAAALFRIMSTEEFAALPDTTLTASTKTYRDVKVIGKDTLLSGRDAFAADRFFWSADAGFVGYVRGGERWWLVEVE